jgi:hypothetical protein
MAEDKPGTYTREHNGVIVVCAKPKPPAERAAQPCNSSKGARVE